MRRPRTRNVALRRRGLKRISSSARAEPPGSDPKVQPMFSIATASIWLCEERVLNCVLPDAAEGRQSNRYRIVEDPPCSAECKHTQSLSCLLGGLPSRSSPRLHRQGQKRSAFAKATARQPRKLSGLEARGFEPLTSSLQSWRSTN